MTKYKYMWKHTLTGKAKIEAIEAETRLEFLEKLNQWNRVGRGVWVYWEVV